MAATISNLANGVDTTADTAVSTGATVTAAVGDWLVVLVAASNDETNGASSISGVVDSDGVNVYTQRAIINYDPGAAGAGATLGIFTCAVTQALSNDTITVNFSVNTSQKAVQVYKVVPGASETIAFVAADTTGSTGAATTHSAATVSVTSGHMIWGCASIETDDAVTDDTDTTNGSWSTVVTRLADGGADASTMSCSSQYKTVTATGNQAWACTTASSRDSARTYLVLSSLVAYTIAADAGAYTYTGSAAGLAAGRKIVADAGAYAYSGEAANLRRGFSLTAAAGAYALTGEAANLRRGFSLTAAAGAYALTGEAATLRADRRIAAAAGAYALTGDDTTLTYTPSGGGGGPTALPPMVGIILGGRLKTIG